MTRLKYLVLLEAPLIFPLRQVIHMFMSRSTTKPTNELYAQRKIWASTQSDQSFPVRFMSSQETNPPSGGQQIYWSDCADHEMPRLIWVFIGRTDFFCLFCYSQAHNTYLVRRWLSVSALWSTVDLPVSELRWSDRHPRTPELSAGSR